MSVVGNNAFLKVTPEELRTKANQIQTMIQQMDECLSNMRNSFTTVSDNWGSTAGDAFKERADVLIAESAESLENLRFYVDDLNQAAAKYDEVEADLQSKVGALGESSDIFNI